MYKRNDSVYADAGNILVGNGMIGYRLQGELADFTERQLDLNNIERNGNTVMVDGVLHGYDPDMSFSDTVEKWMKAQYSEEEQVAIMQNGEENQEDYDRMMRWRSWCEQFAHAILGDTDIDFVKKTVIRKIAEYDKSSAVNEFFYNSVPMWIDKNTRSGLLMRFNAEKDAGIEHTTLWYNSQSFTLSPDAGIMMVKALELYASECYDKTAEHKANVMALSSIDDVLAYDYTSGYPEKLHF